MFLPPLHFSGSGWWGPEALSRPGLGSRVGLGLASLTPICCLSESCTRASWSCRRCGSPAGSCRARWMSSRRRGACRALPPPARPCSRRSSRAWRPRSWSRRESRCHTPIALACREAQHSSLARQPLGLLAALVTNQALGSLSP